MARIKNLWLLVVAFVSMTLSSCKEGGPSFPDHTPKIETVVETKFSISKNEVNFTTSDSVSMTIQIYAKNVEWAITGVPNWITVVPMSGSGDTEVRIACSENKDITSRQGVFVVNGQYNNQKFPDITVGVTQPRCALRYATVDKKEYVFNGTPIDTLLKVSGNTDLFQVEESDKLKEWCNVTADINKMTVSIKSASINKGNVPNEGFFYLTTSDGSQTVKVTQRPLYAASYSSTVDFSVKGGRKTIQIDGLCLDKNTSNDWIESEVSYDGEHTFLTIAVTKNYSINDRNGFVYLTMSNGSLLEVPIHQECVVFDLNYNSLYVNAIETDTVIHVITNVPWRFDAITADWVVVDPLSSDSAYSVFVKINKNSTLNERSTTISVYPDWLKDLRQNIDIVQDGVNYNIDSTTIILSCESDTVELFVTTNGDWTASSTDDWISLLPGSGTGDGIIQVRVADNKSLDEREGAVKISIAGNTETIMVRQDGIQLSVSPDITFTSRGGSISLSVQTNTEWEIVAQDEWIKVSRNNMKGDGSFLVTASDNQSDNERNGSIVFRSDKSGKQFRFNVIQQARYLNVLADSIDFFAKGGNSDQINIETDGVVSVESQESWIMVDKQSNEHFTVSVSRNDTGLEREGKVKIFLTDLISGTLERELVITQAAPYFNVTIDSILFSCKGGETESIIINTDGITEVSSDLEWITITKESETQYVVYSMLFEGDEERSGIVHVTLKGLDSLFSKEIVVVQASPYFNVPIDSIRFSFKGGETESIIINTDGTTEVSTDLEWITITKESETQYVVHSMLFEGDEERSGIVHVTLKGLDGSFSKDIVVAQAPSILNVSVDSLYFYYRGGTTDLITISANGDIVITTDCNWLTITQNSSASFVVKVDENKDDSIRIGEVLVSFKNTSVHSKEIIFTQDFDDPQKRYGSVDLGLSVLWSEREVYYDQLIFDDNTIFDALSLKMGPYWRLPTSDEAQELMDNCNWSLSTINHRGGYMFEGNSHSIFLMGGWYALSSSYDDYAYFFLDTITSSNNGIRNGASYDLELDPPMYRAVRPYDYQEGDCVNSISLSVSNIELNLGDTYTFYPLFKCDNDKEVVKAPFDCVPDDETICIVDTPGHITALAPGLSNLMFSAGTSGVAFCSVKVVVPRISSRQDNVSLAIGDSFTLQVLADKMGCMIDAPNTWFEWSSDNKRVATVNSDGVVTALEHGYCNITIKCGDAQSSCKIYVQEPPLVRDMVDMGVSVMWGACNIGAVSYDEIGGLYAWGETKIKEKADTWSDYLWCRYSSNTPFFIRYCTDSANGFKDNKTVLNKEDDVAYIKLGEGWRMPTKEEYEELISNCIVEKKVTANLLEFTSKITGNKLYFYYRYDQHYGGYASYWTSSLKKDQYTTTDQYAHVFSTDAYLITNYPVLPGDWRYSINAVRPVYESNIIVPYSDLKINNKNLTLHIGDTLTLFTTIKRGNNTLSVPVEWISTNEAVVYVSDDGFVSALSLGPSMIVATFEELHDTCYINVTDIVGGHDYVDLGLSVLWATCNVGASSPEEYGDYYAWGETESKSDYSWSTYVYCDGSENTLTKYNNNVEYGTVVDDKTELDPEDDVAHSSWGSNWRMPTKDEYEELISNCIWTWTTQKDVNGYIVTSQIQGYTDRYIFIPAAGQYYTQHVNNAGIDVVYWSSSLVTILSKQAWVHGYDSKSHGTWMYNRCYGRPVRPVYGLPNHEGVIDDLDDMFD